LIVISLCVTVAAALGLYELRRRFVVIHVAGASMLPAFRNGDRVLVRRGGAGRLAVGAVVVLRPPQPRSARHAVVPGHAVRAGRRWVIKRVAALPGDPVPDSVRDAARGIRVVPAGQLVLLSDNPAGNDSRRWGLVPASGLLGFVIATLPPGGRHRAENPHPAFAVSAHEAHRKRRPG
jgi:signal peptidase I